MSRWAPLLCLLAAAAVAPKGVRITEFPWHVALEVMLRPGHECSGSIIGPTWVLTAASCTKRYTAVQLIVKAGSTIHHFPKARYRVATVIQHEDYDELTDDNNIALLETRERISFNKRVQVVNLGWNELAGGTEVNVTGWGHEIPVLRADTKFIVDHDTCQSAWLPRRRVIAPSLICADEDAEGMECHGRDKGGAVVVGDTQYAIRVDGYECNYPRVPGLYTSVPALRSWIAEKTGI